MPCEIMALIVGTKLGSHEITGLLGKGGMGEVYRARDTKLDRDVAIKVLPEAFARDAARMTRFGREAKLLAALDHPNIAVVYGLEDSGGTRALVMQLAEGPTLADRISKGPIPIEETLPIVRQIAEALEYAHEHGIIHRDLKPANVKVSTNDIVKLLDFGLAKAMESEPSAESISDSPTLSRMATQAGVLLGTAAYMSPEQAKGKMVDRRADIWAFGCVVYEMLTGMMAFHGNTVTETLAAVIKEEPDWSRLPAATPMRVRVVLQRCLQKDARQRLRDIGDARISLDEVLSGAPEALSVAGEKSGALSDLMRLEISLPDKLSVASTGAFAVSPDGRHLAFAGTGSDGSLRLWVRSLDSLDARPLYGSEANLFTPFFWSPDSRFLAFQAGGKLKKIDINGGPAQLLCDTSDFVVGGAWGRDELILFGQARGGIMRVRADGAAASPVTIPDPSRKEVGHVQPSLLPDGRHFTYLRWSQQPENLGIYAGSVDCKAEEQDLKRIAPTHVGPAYVPPSEPGGMGQLLFLRDGTLITQSFDANRLGLAGEPVPLAKQIGSVLTNGFFSVSKNGVLVYRTGGEITQLTWCDQRGKRLAVIGEPAPYTTVSLSPDGTRAAVCRSDVEVANQTLWLMDLGRGTSTRFTFDKASAPVGIWSPDGSRIIFALGGGGKFDLYQKLASGVKEHELLLESDIPKIPKSCSRDGRFLLYGTFLPTTKTRALWVLPLDGNKKPFPFVCTQFNNNDGQFSPDGRWVAYSSDESGRDEIYVRTFSPNSGGETTDDEGKWIISTGGGTEPRWSGDGKTLYYIAADSKIMAVQITADQAFRAGVPKALFQMPSTLWGPLRQSWSVTPDGKRFLFQALPEQRKASFNVVLNWQTALKK
jgi:serine/threonine protein kinase